MKNRKEKNSIINIKGRISFDKNYDYKKLRKKANWDGILKKLENISNDFMRKRVIPPQKRDFD